MIWTIVGVIALSLVYAALQWKSGTSGVGWYSCFERK